MINQKSAGLFALSIALALGIAMVAQAKTPDGVTPAEETICDSFSGALFGLCNSYCEAMDCTDPNQAASDRACQRVLDNFMRKSGGNVPPCVAFCPCFSSADIDERLISDPVECEDTQGVETSIEDDGANAFTVFNEGGWVCQTIIDGTLHEDMAISEGQAADCRQQILNSNGWANCPP